MFLQPRKTKYKKVRKGKLKKLEFKCNDVKFGELGLKSQVAGMITAYQIEAARKTIARKIKRKGKIWIRIFLILRPGLHLVEVRIPPSFISWNLIVWTGGNKTSFYFILP